MDVGHSEVCLFFAYPKGGSTITRLIEIGAFNQRNNIPDPSSTMECEHNESKRSADVRRP